MLKSTSSRLSSVIALVAVAFIVNGVACSSKQPAKKNGAAAEEEDDNCSDSTSTKKSTKKSTSTSTSKKTSTADEEDTELWLADGDDTGTASGSGTGTGTGTGTDEVTYEGKVKTLIDKSCANSGCHAKGDQEPDLSTFAAVKAKKTRFIETLDPDDEKPMPSGGPLGASDLKLLKDWGEGGFIEGEKADDGEGDDTSTASSTKSSTSTKTSTKCSTGTSTSKKTSTADEEEE